MAKRKRLNKRAVILLAVMGGIVVIGAVIVFIQGLPQDPWAHAEAGDKAREAGNYAAAYNSYGLAVDNAKKAKPPHADTYLFYYKRGELLLDWIKLPGLSRAEWDDKYRKALDDLRNAIRYNPRCVEAQRRLFEVAWESSYSVHLRPDLPISPRWDLCIAEADKLIELEPNDHSLYSRRGFAHAVLAKTFQDPNNIVRAESDLKKAVELKKDEFKYWADLASFYGDRNRPADAEKVFEQGITANPDSANLRAAYAGFLVERTPPRLDDARKQLQDAVDRQPTSTVGRLGLARLSLREKKWEEAQKALDAAKAIDRADIRIYLLEADLCQQQRQSDRRKVADVYRAGLEAIAGRVASAPTSQEAVERHRVAQAKEMLNSLLGNVLLDMADTAKGEDRTKLVTEAKGCIGQPAAMRQEVKLKLQGRIALIEGRTAEAMKLLEEANKRFPGGDLQTSILLADLYLGQGSPGDAQKVLSKILEKRPPLTASVWLIKARIASQYYRDYDEAARNVAQALGAEPGNPDALRLREAFNAIRSPSPTVPPGLEITPEISRMFMDRAETLLADRQFPKAFALVKALHDRDPENLAVVSRLYNLYLMGGDKNSARELVKRVTDKHPENKRLKNELEMLTETDPNRQFAMRVKLIETDPELNEFRKEMELAGLHARVGDGQQYVVHLKKAVEVDPNQPFAVEQLVSVAVATKDWPLAEHCLNLARQGDLDKVGGKLFSAQLAMAREKWDQAKADLTEVLKQNPEMKQAQVMLAMCYLTTSKSDADLAKAEELLKEVTGKDPGNIRALILMAQLKEAKGEMAEHPEMIRRLNKLVPQDPYVRNWYTEYMEEGSNIDEVIKRREAKRQDNPMDLRNCQRLADLYRRKGEMATYQATIMYIHKVSPDREFATSVLCEYLLSLNQTGEVDKQMDALIKGSKDKVRAWTIYGGFLSQYAPRQAENAFKEAIDANPKDERGYLGMADFLARSRRWQESANYFEKASALKPANLSIKKAIVRYRIYGKELVPAASQLEKLLEANPGDAEALTLKGLIAMRQKDPDYRKAQDLFDQAISINPNGYEPLQLRAQVHIAQGNPVMAKRDLQAARQLTSSPEILMQLAEIHRQVGEPEQAEAVYRGILAGRKDYEPAYSQLMDLYMSLRKWDRLQPLLEEAKRAFPKSAGVWMAEAAMWQRRGEKAKGIAAFAEAYKLAPKAELVMDRYYRALLDGEQYDLLLKVSEENANPIGIGPWVIAIRAAAAAKLKDIPRADELFKSALKDAGRLQLEPMTGILEQAYGLETAIAKLSEWVAARQEDWRLHYALGLLHLRAGDSDKAELSKGVSRLTKARDLTSESLEKALANNLLGVTCYSMHMIKEAEEAYRAVLAAEPNDIRALNNLAYLLANDREDPNSAMPYIRRAMEQLDEEQDILDTYGWVLTKARNYREAERTFLRAAQVREASETLHYHLGYVYEETGRLDEALRHYRQGLEMLKGKESNPVYGLLSESVKRVDGKLSSTRSGT